MEAAKPGDKPVRTLEYKGFAIAATPYKEGGQWQTCGTVTKTIGGEVKEHRFVRADRFSDEDAAAEHAILKGQQIVDQLGAYLFKINLYGYGEPLLFPETIDMIEKMCIQSALELTGNNRASAAEMLGLSRQSLYVKLRRFDMVAEADTENP